MAEIWKNAIVSPPKSSGAYIVGEIQKLGKSNQTAMKMAVYLKKGEEYIVRQEQVDLSKPENKMMFAVCKYDTIVVAQKSGFYEIIKKSQGNDISYMNQEKLVWTTLPMAPEGSKSEYDVIKARLRAYHDNVDIERKEVMLRIKDYVVKEGNIANVMNALICEFGEDTYESCGVLYSVSVSEIEKAFLRALIIREEIKNLSEFKEIDKVCLLSFDRAQVKNFSADEAIGLRSRLSKFMEDKEYSPEDIDLICDAFFTYVFLPSKKEMLKVFYKDEKKKSENEDRNSFYTRLYQRYITNQAVRMVAACYAGKSKPKDTIIDGITLKDLTIALAVPKFGIEAFTERFEEEMGIK